MTGIEYPKTQKGQETFAALVETAGKQFYKKTYHGSTIKDITEETGVGLGTFYIYFKSKLVCYEYLLRQYSHKIRSNIAQRIEGLTSQREIEKVGLMVFLEMVRDDQHMYNIIWDLFWLNQNFSGNTIPSSQSVIRRVSYKVRKKVSLVKEIRRSFPIS